FGLIAWTFPLELAALGRPLLKRQSPQISGLRIAGDLVVAIVLSVLVLVAAPSATAFGHMRAGCNVSLLFGELFAALFSTWGSYLIGLSIVGLILIGRSSFSFIEWCEKAAALFYVLKTRGAYWARRARGAWAFAR